MTAGKKAAQRPIAVIPATNGRPESDGAMRKCRSPDSGRATLARMTEQLGDRHTYGPSLRFLLKFSSW
jgi:hypothetical protein